MPTLASIIFMKADRSRKRRAGRMCGASFTSLQVAHASPIAAEALKRIAELYAIEGEIRGRPPEERLQSATLGLGLCCESLHHWLRDDIGCRVTEVRDRSGDPLLRWDAGVRCCATVKTATSRSTTTPPNGRCGPSPWDGRTICSRDPIPVANGLPQFTA